MAIVKLKRVRNSFLDVSKLPPEVLGDIFRWNVMFDGDFGRLGERSHNFLLVCRHWFEVASCTPEIWSFWGNNLQDWTKRHLLYPTAPLDLVLHGATVYRKSSINDSIRSALQDHAARDAIRKVHLTAANSELLDSIISPLAGDYEEARPSNVESIILVDESEDSSVDVSDFFAYYRFPKLYRLELDNCTISSWDLMMSRTSVLTTLLLGFTYPSPAPTTPELLSIISSNPSLQKLTVFGYAVPEDGGGGSSHRVSLLHLKELELVGESGGIFGLLRRLEHPGDMDRLDIVLVLCTVDDIREFIQPYLRGYLWRRERSQSGLGLDISWEGRIKFCVGDVGGVDFSAPGSAWMNNFMEVVIHLDDIPPRDVLDEVFLDLIAAARPEEVAYFKAYDVPISTRDLSTQFPSLRALHLEGTPLHVAFPEPTAENEKMALPSLERITLDQVPVRRGNWSPLTTFLTHRASSGYLLDVLEIYSPRILRSGVEEIIRGAVREFRMRDSEVETIIA